MNNFGQRQHTEKFVPMLVGKLVRGEEIPVHAQRVRMRLSHDGGSQDTWKSGSRVWLHADNHADAMKFIIEHPSLVDIYSEDVRYPQKLNVVGEQELKNDEVVDLAATILGVTPRIRYTDFHSSRPGHDLRYAMSGEKIAQLGWKAPVPFRESFEQTVKWFAKRIR